MQIEHVAMYVEDLEAARDFFVKYFQAQSNGGYHNQTTNFRSYFLSFEEGARLEIMNRPDIKQEEHAQLHTGYTHIAFRVGSKARVDELTKQLKADGYQILSGPRTTGDGYYESCIVGIEHNRIEITI